MVAWVNLRKSSGFWNSIVVSLFCLLITFCVSSFNNDLVFGVIFSLILTFLITFIISSAGNSVIEMRVVRNVFSYLMTTSAKWSNRPDQKNDQKTPQLSSETVQAGSSASWIAQFRWTTFPCLSSIPVTVVQDSHGTIHCKAIIQYLALCQPWFETPLFHGVHSFFLWTFASQFVKFCMLHSYYVYNFD